jgi:bifunctional UDP-N-acetylglucosamine pyrophosphorylase/glucosamine-1-phosphate N-acetyltransferase
MNITKAVILAAGEGSRMRPLTYTRPKVMLPIANRPILEHLLLEMLEAGIRELFFIVGYHDEQIRDYFGNGNKWGVNIQYCNQRKQLGTADALRMVEDYLNEDFLMANGDIIIDHQEIERLTQQNGHAMSVIEMAEVAGLGVIEVKDGKVVRIYEKMANPPSHMANAGLYRFSPEVFNAIAKTPKSPRGEYEITDSIQILIDSGQPVYHQVIGRWLDLSYPWDLLAANEKLLAELKPQCSGEIEEGAIINGPVSVGKCTTIRAGSYIVGPAIIGQNCDIGPNCFIRASTAIGDNCHIGASVEVKNCIIMNGAKVPHLNYVGDSIIGENCNLGAGTKVANLKLDKKNIKVNDMDTKRRKLGVIMGDNVQTGINASINVGTLIGNNVFIGPGAMAHGTISPDSRIF